ncbi:MAG: glycosyltransferase [Anaerolineae bacterium]|nr:glycosyltransferase [Anaerolineae bacterium]MBL8105651.1 glycosyltransferase [Anaerolineales bacterium]MCC7188758.1 glycosyltransferase [Anaerolineales bacterium]
MMTSKKPNPRKPHIVFYFSDTGGGHRSAAEAIIEAVHLEYKNNVTTEMVDFFKDYAPPPFNRVGEMYPYMVKAPRLWQASFYATDGRAQARVITATTWPIASRGAKALVRQHPADLIVTVHPFANTFALRALGKDRPPFINVVTDMVTTHALWYDKRADLILVPTKQAYENAIRFNMPPEKVRVVGLPVADKYCKPLGRKSTLRKKLGWTLDKPIVLLVGGGEGMGPLAKTARAIDASGLDVGLVIVCGRNQRLKATLEAERWENPTFIYGFTRDMPDFMRASDFIVTKAGPGTIAEALNAELPIILYSKLPGQEDGNVTFVEEEGAGVWAPKPQDVVRALTRWVSRPAEKQKVIENCRRAGRPEAARVIARTIGKMLGMKIKQVQK